jgi:hypothetical protein
MLLTWHLVNEHSTFLSISRCLREQVKLLQRRKENWDNDFVPNILLLPYEIDTGTLCLLQILQTRLVHSFTYKCILCFSLLSIEMKIS